MLLPAFFVISALDFTPNVKEVLVDTSLESVNEDSVKLTLVHNGVETDVETNAATVQDLLVEKNIEIDENIHVSAELHEDLYDTMEIVVSEK